MIKKIIERRSVSKGCKSEYEITECKQLSLGSKMVLTCTCDTDFCNGEKNIFKATGLLSETSKAAESKSFSIVFILLHSILMIALSKHM